MKIYCTLKLKGIETQEDFDRNFSSFNRILNLDDIHFIVPSFRKNDDEFLNLHLDFNYIDGHFYNGNYVVRLKELADTWNELNEEESNIQKEDITLELLDKGYVTNYVLFFNKDDGSTFKDIKITEIGYLDDLNNEIYFEIEDTAENEA